MDVAAMVASLEERIALLTRARDLLAGLAGQGTPEPKRRTMSLEGRQRIAAAQRKRWAARNAVETTPPVVPVTVTVLKPKVRRERRPRIPERSLTMTALGAPAQHGPVAVSAAEVARLRERTPEPRPLPIGSSAPARTTGSTLDDLVREIEARLQAPLAS